ncbi:MAG: ATP-binding protein, partial [Pelagibacteraceae bacterium]
QTKRCSDILEQISKKEIREDKFINKIKVENLLDELINSFVGTTEKDINLINKEDKNSISIIRTPELVYGIKNFIDNAVKFANSLVEVHLLSDKKNLIINISDDGPGFAEDILDSLGDPYLKSKTTKRKYKAGLGLGVFLSKNLLEKKKAKVEFANGKYLKGASVQISWKIKSIIS